MKLKNMLKKKLPATFNALEYETTRILESMDTLVTDLQEEVNLYVVNSIKELKEEICIRQEQFAAQQEEFSERQEYFIKQQEQFLVKQEQFLVQQECFIKLQNQLLSQLSDITRQMQSRSKELQLIRSDLRTLLTTTRFSYRAIYGIDAFVMNQFLLGSGASMKENKRYVFFQQIKKLLTVASVSDDIPFKRFGNEHDGGYVMLNDINNKKVAYSFGINNDVSLELDLASLGLDIYLYDHTIEKLPEENRKFHFFKTGIADKDGKDGKPLKTMQTLLKENGHENENGMILKMDVEGYEWEVFKQISTDVLSKFDQIVLELHWLLYSESGYPDISDLEFEELVLTALNNLNQTHQLVHLHANNYAAVCYSGDICMPNTLEATFLIKNGLYQFKDVNEKFVMRPEDQRNNVEREEVVLWNWGQNNL